MTEPAHTDERRKLARVTGSLGLATIVTVLGPSIVNDYASIPFDAGANETVAFFRSLDDAMGWAGSYVTILGLMAMLFFTLGLAMLLRRYEGALPWCSVFLGAAGVVSVVSGQIGSWDGATLRSADINPDVARYAFDLGNISFANGWVSLGAVSLCAGFLIVRSAGLPSWLGYWALLAGLGQIVARGFWTHPAALIPGAIYWVWVVVVSVLLMRGRFLVTDDA